MIPIISTEEFFAKYCTQPPDANGERWNAGCFRCTYYSTTGCTHPRHPHTPLQAFLRTYCVGGPGESCYRDGDERCCCHYATYDGCGHPEHPRNKQAFEDIADVFQTTD